MSALHESGTEFEEEAGEVHVRFVPGTSEGDPDVIEFIGRLAQAAPRHWLAVMRGATWVARLPGWVWDTREIARRAA